MATLLTHTGLVLFLVAAAVTSRLGDEQGLVVANGDSLTVQPIGTPGPAARPQPRLLGAGLRHRPPDRLHDPPRRVPGRAPDRRQGDPRQRPAHRGRLHVPPERLRPGARPGHPRRGGQAAVDRAGPDDRPGCRLPVRPVRRARARCRAPAPPPAGDGRDRRAARAADQRPGHQPRREPQRGEPRAARARAGRGCGRPRHRLLDRAARRLAVHAADRQEGPWGARSRGPPSGS